MIALLMFASTVAQPALAQPALNPLAPFVGHCWSGDAPGGAGTDTHCFEAAYGGEHVRDRHTVKVDGKAVYAGETIYSVEQGAITFTYWNSLGGVGHGTAAAGRGPDGLPGRDARGAVELEPSRCTRPGSSVPDGYRVVWPDGTPHLMKRAD